MLWTFACASARTPTNEAANRHAPPLTRPLTKLSIDTLGTFAASNWVHNYNPNFPLAFTNSVSEMSPFGRHSINDDNWLKNVVPEVTRPVSPLLELVAAFRKVGVAAALAGAAAPGTPLLRGCVSAQRLTFQDRASLKKELTHPCRPGRVLSTKPRALRLE